MAFQRHLPRKPNARLDGYLKKPGQDLISARQLEQTKVD